MKKLFIILGLMACLTANAKSDFKYGAFNHLGVGVSAGTTGIGFNASTCLTKWLGLRAGVNVMPGFNINATYALDQNVPLPNNENVTLGDVDIKASLARTTVDVILDAYPFGGWFFVSAGFSFGGGTLLKVKGHSDDVAEFYKTHSISQYPIELEDIKIPVDENGDISGGIKTADFRPYLGLGFGPRAVPRSRIGFRFELGLQFHGRPKVYGGGYDDLLKDADIEGADDISKIADKLTVYPVLRFSLVGRIL